MEDFANLTPPIALSLDVIDPNEGQMAERGLPENPRTIRDERFEQLKANITKYPQFLRQNSLIVYPYTEGRYLIIGGNQRYAALKDLGYDKVPCHILPAETPVENLKAFVVLDNSPFGQWDWMKLQSEDWDADQLQDWGVEMPIMETDMDIDNFFDTLDDSEQKEKPEHITLVLPDDLKEQKSEIKDVIKEALGAYSGITFK